MKRLWPLLLIPILVVWLAAPREGPHLILPGVTVASSQGAPVDGGGLLGAPSAGVAQWQSASPRSRAEEVAGSNPASGEPSSGGAPKPSSKLGDWSCSAPPLCGETPQPRIVDGISGTATFYCRPGISRCTVGYPFGMYAAAGPKLRTMLGPDWRGRTVVVVDANGRGVLVQLIDFCACGGDHVIDLYWTAYQGLVNPVTVKEEP